MISGLKKRITNKVQHLYEKHVLEVPDRSDNPYCTHVPILLAAGRWQKISSVLEFGCGEYSTKVFLDRRFFPHLRTLVSYENDSAWATRLRNQIGADVRLDLRDISGLVASVVDQTNLEAFDLIFIDDSMSASERIQTIKAVAAKSPRRPIVAIHDFENHPYRIAAKAFKNTFRFTGLNPNTGLLWNNDALVAPDFRKLNSTLRKHPRCSEVSEWNTHLEPVFSGHSQ